MSQEWKQGDVVVLDWTNARGEQRIALAMRVQNSAEARWVTATEAFPADDWVTNARPLVVIDPELLTEGSGRFAADLLIACADIVQQSDSGRELAEVRLLRELAERIDATVAPPKPYRTYGGQRAPWPEVNECHSWHLPDHECPQCSWEHEHDWVAWPLGAIGYGVPIRCSKCGARKCDQDLCAKRRHTHTHHDEESPS